MEITLRYSAIDDGPWSRRRARKYQTIAGARRFAHKWVGKTPEISEQFGYAVSSDGIGKITVVNGCEITGYRFAPPSVVQT